MNVDELIARSRAWLGVPYHHQGRSRHGVDCVGLPEVVLREAGALPAGFVVDLHYGRLPRAELAAGLERWCQRIAAPERGCLLALQWPRTGVVSHVAILAGETMIHSYRSYGVCESAYRGVWLRWTRSAWRLPGVAYE